jgi:hypothetical protein
MAKRPDVDALAREFLSQKLVVEREQEVLDRIRGRLTALVLAEGQAPPRASKTIALVGEAYEARVSRPVEVTVDRAAALRIRDACRRAGCQRLFGKLFRRVEMFVLAGRSEALLDKRLPARAPRGLRAMFARAVRVRELPPQIEVRGRSKGREAA